MSFDPPDYYGVSKKEKEKLKEWNEYESKHIRIHPNATPREVIGNLESAKEVPDGYGHFLTRYKNEDWLYTMQQTPKVGTYLIAYYLPSMNKELKIMYHWDRTIGKSWELLTHKEGDW